MPETRLERTRKAYRDDKASDPQTGISLRFIRHYNADADKMPSPLDVEMIRMYRPSQPLGVRILNG